MPAILARTSPKGVPVVSILLATVIGLIGFGPFPTWSAMVSAVTGATAVMYAMGPVALGALKRNDPDRQRPYSTPMPRVVLPAAGIEKRLVIKRIRPELARRSTTPTAAAMRPASPWGSSTATSRPATCCCRSPAR